MDQMSQAAPGTLTQLQLEAIAEGHGLDLPVALTPLGAGAASAVYRLSDRLVLRVAKSGDEQAVYAREERLVPLVRAAGVHTPAIVASGLVPGETARAYQIMERVHGTALSALRLPFAETTQVYRDLGRDLARWHGGQTTVDQRLPYFPHDDHPDPRPAIEDLTAQGYLSGETAQWFVDWLDRLAPEAATPLARRLVHGDARPSNVMVEGQRPAYRALLDWGDAKWADPATEFAFLPLRAVPFALEGYRELRPGASLEVNEVRVLWYQLAWAVLALGRAPSMEGTWTAPPAGRMLELLRFFSSQPDEPWKGLFSSGR